jgi:pSer/pThr/pTyr-binding forkhead associated (FHA) protein
MASLQIEFGLGHPRRIPLDLEVTTVGRSEECDIRFPHPAVSRRHFRIIRQDDGFFIEDMGTLPGTRVNDQPIRGVTRLFNGDRIRVADYKAVFEDDSVGDLERQSP